MSRQELQAKVLEIIHEQKGPVPEGFTADTPLVDLGVDSLDSLSLLFAIEEQFSISIPDERARSIRTLNHMLDAIEEQLPA